MDEQPTEAESAARLFCRRAARWARLSGRVVLLVIVLYVLIIVIGLIPVNNDFEPAADGVEVILVSSLVHADLVLPVKNQVVDWREMFPADCFAGDTSRATHVAIGWGDKGFYLETPTWADLRASTAAKALLWPSDTCMHVTMADSRYFGISYRSVTITFSQYQELVRFIGTAFKRSTGRSVVRVPCPGYGQRDAFFEAHGTYHCLNTCNSWVGRAMRRAGIRTPWLTPVPGTVFLYLPNESASEAGKEV